MAQDRDFFTKSDPFGSQKNDDYEPIDDATRAKLENEIFYMENASGVIMPVPGLKAREMYLADRRVQKRTKKEYDEYMAKNTETQREDIRKVNEDKARERAQNAGYTADAGPVAQPTQ